MDDIIFIMLQVLLILILGVAILGVVAIGTSGVIDTLRHWKK